jgi:NitT/TauT family transport system substrate-binding protein
MGARADEDEGKVLVNEASLWPNGQFPTTVLIVSTSFLNAHPAVVSNFLKGLVGVVNWTVANPTAAENAANSALTILASKPLFENVLLTAWSHLQFTVDPVASAWHQRDLRSRTAQSDPATGRQTDDQLGWHWLRVGHMRGESGRSE